MRKMDSNDLIIENVISAEIVFENGEKWDITDSVVNELTEIGIMPQKEPILIPDKKLISCPPRSTDRR